MTGARTDTTISTVNHEIAREWISQRRRFAIATLIESEGSAPLESGAMLLVDDSGSVEGSVTGGCVEGALVHEAGDVLAGAGARVRRYGISDELAADVGLMCGGTVHVLIDAPDPDSLQVIDEVLGAAIEGRPAALATLCDGEAMGSRMGLLDDEVRGSLRGPELLDESVARDMLGALEGGVTSLRRYGSDGAAMGAELRVHVRSFAEPPRMVIFGAIDFSAATARLARQLGYRVTIVDARDPFVASRRFSDVAEVVVDWPDRYLGDHELKPRDVALVFTHDPKFDEPALISALRSGAGYIGALGSRRTQRQRAERLRDAGLAEDEIERIAAPCGLDVGARTPAETAVSILAEVIARQNGRSGEALSDTEGQIHPRHDLARL